MLAVQLFAVPIHGAYFGDVPSEHWAAQYINEAVEKEFILGVGGGNFAPDVPVSLPEFTTMLVNAFYPQTLALVPTGPNWFDCYMNAAEEVGLLDGLDYRPASASCWTGADQYQVSRYDMAQMMANLLENQDITVGVAQQQAALFEITDSVPQERRSAVATCYALGLLSGIGNGQFGGDQTMTRSQACVVLLQLDEQIKNSAETLTSGSYDSTGSFGVKIQVALPWPKHLKSLSDYGGIELYIMTATAASGYLTNGEPITEDNVLELLQNAKRLWPSGTAWGSASKLYIGECSWIGHYLSAGQAVRSALQPLIGVADGFVGYLDMAEGCSGYAAMISEYLFGNNGTVNPMREVPLEEVRPGDVLVRMDGQKVSHVMVALESYPGKNGSVCVTDANWPEIRWGDAEQSENCVTLTSNYRVFTRYAEAK